jgi:DNA-binding beta-propeller fold protein YncE/mono/diheme cytochrome c family protein
MVKPLLGFVCLLLPLLSLVAPSAGPQSRPVQPAAARPVYKSPLGLAVDREGRRAYVALQGAGAVAVVDLRAGKVLREIPVGKGACDLALSGRALFVACEGDDALVRVDLDKLAVSGRWATGQAPRGVTVLPDAGQAFVVCHDAQSLAVVDLKTGRVTSAALPGWPERLVLHRDAQHPFLLALSTRPGEALVSLVDMRPPLRVLQSSRLAGVTNARGLASRQGASSLMLVTHQKPRTRVPATQLAQGWVFTNAVSALSPGGGETRPGGDNPTGLLDDPLRGYADPADVVLTPDCRHAFVACAGADTVLALQTERFASANYGPAVWDDQEHGKDDLALTRRYVVARLATQANPRRLALSGDGRTLVVSNHLADSLTVIDAGSLRVLRHVALGGPAPDAARRGAVLFHSGRMTFQGQFTCASCHPGGGSDGLNWDLPRDGVGNFLNTRSLLGVRDTAPYGWQGSSPTLADRVAGTLRTLQRHEPQGTEVDDLVAYLKTLDPPRPLPRRQADAAAVARGEALFEGKGRCARCHRGDALQDVVLHDVGTRVPGDLAGRFDTPSLRGVSRTAPYLHHGQAQTLEDVFTRFNAQARHGSAHLLSREELADLVAYLKSL